MTVLDTSSVIPVVGYQHHAIALNILFTNQNKGELYMANNYIQLVCIPGCQNSLNFYPVPNSFLKCLKAEDVYHDIDVLRLVERSISENTYLMGYADMFYVPYTKEFGKRHFNHEIMIYGNENDIFYTSYYDKTGYFTKHILPKECVVTSINENKVLNKKALTKLHLNEDFNFELNIKEIIAQLIYLLNSVNLDIYDDIIPPPDNALFGLEAERCFLCEMEAHLDINEFHILYEHKKCMIARLETISKKCHIKLQNYVDKYKEIASIASGLRNQKLKNKMKHSVELIDNKMALHMIDLEENLLPDIINELLILL